MTNRTINVGSVEWNPPTYGHLDAPILVVCDAPTAEAHRAGLPMSMRYQKFFIDQSMSTGFRRNDFCFVGLCAPLNRSDAKSAARKWRHVEHYLADLRAKVLDKSSPRVVVTLGDLATRAVIGRPTKITKARGIVHEREGMVPVLPMLSPGFVLRLPEHETAFTADMRMLQSIKRADYDVANFLPAGGEYEWCTDLREYLPQINERRVLSVDTETQGGARWWDPDVRLLSVQLSWRPGHAIVCPVDADWWARRIRPHRPGSRLIRMALRQTARVLLQLRRVLEDQTIRKIGQNIKFEQMMLRKVGIELRGWLHDTQLMAFNVDENIINKGLDDLVKLFVPEMAGYADSFNEATDKSNMAGVPFDDFLSYAGADADACLRLAQRLQPMVTADDRQNQCYRTIQLPAIQCFANTVERFGIKVDTDRLESFTGEIRRWVDDTYRSLIARVPADVKLDHAARGKDLKFSRADFVRDVLFTEAGFGLEPKVFTEGTTDLPADQRVASTSAKMHLPYHVSHRARVPEGGTVGSFVKDLIDYQKANKLLTTYVGQPATEDILEDDGIRILAGRLPATGIWQYMSPENKVHPSYMLHRTNTRRTASADPNGQNFPVRGSRFAESYQDIFVPSEGFTMFKADMSQIELRLVAWSAMEETMLRIYNQEGGDIHSLTAAEVAMGIPYAQYMAMSKAEKGDSRFHAKAINFGFIYGMSAYGGRGGGGGFQRYAKTDFGLDFSEGQCQRTRNGFFEKYWGLTHWHDAVKDFATEHGYVRSLHGAVRHLPSLGSDDSAIVAAALRYAVNSPIQGFASELGVLALIRLCHQADPRVLRVIGFIHDALVIEARTDLVVEMASAVKWVMDNAPFDWFGLEPPLPIIADVELAGDDGEKVSMRAVKPDWWVDDEREAARMYASGRWDEAMSHLQVIAN